MSLWVLGLAFVLSSSAMARPAETTIDRVVQVFDGRACGGCHRGNTAWESMAHFTIDGGRQELLKSLAYRHVAMRARAVAGLGEKVLAHVRTLESPSIDPTRPGTLELFENNFTRDGDVVSPQDHAALARWWQEGAPLPADVLDEVYEEIRRYVGHFRR